MPMRRASQVCLALLLAVVSIPAFAGTVYVPILAENGMDDTEYLTRVWLTNHGSTPVEVETLFLPNNTDGTKGRDEGNKKTTKATVRAGRTTVIALDQGPGLFEISTEGGEAGLAVNAEIRIPGKPASETIHSTVPVLRSANVTEAGKTLTLQGLRRTEAGVFSNLVLVNLGHEDTQCRVSVFHPGGDPIAGTALLNLKALTQVQYPDALGILQVKEGQDVHTQVSCDQDFFGYLTKYEKETGDVLVTQPSGTLDSTLFRPGLGEPSVPGAVVFTRNGTFHTPTPGEPSKIFNIPVPEDETFGNVVVDFDFFHGGWYAPEPNKNHSLFWLHRGACCWPKWQGNITGFANAFGPGENLVKVVSTMDLPPEADKSKGQVRAGLQPGRTYHLHFEYDTNTGVSFMEITEGDDQVAHVTMTTTVSRLRPDDSGAWMIYFGHEDATGHGPERPTFGWRYQNLRVEFLP